MKLHFVKNRDSLEITRNFSLNVFSTAVVMDTDILIEDKHCFYGDDFLDELTKEYQWSSLLDVADASPSEILADAASILLPPISPDLSIKSSPTASSNSDSGSEDDYKNSPSGTSERQSSQSSFNWLFTFDSEVSNDLNAEDIEQFLQKTACVPNHNPDLPHKAILERRGPVMAIENGIIKGVKIETDYTQTIEHTNNINLIQTSSEQNIQHQNAYFKVINENSLINNVETEDRHITLNNEIRLVVEPKKVPCILKRPNIVNKPNVMISADCIQADKIAIPPLPKELNSSKEVNGYQIKMSPPKSNIVLSQNSVTSITSNVIQNSAIPNVECPDHPAFDISNLSEFEIRALKKQQRMIKNRESACQSRQKKKEYVTSLEQQLLEAHQKIAQLRLENKLLRDQVENNGKSRKIPRLDTSYFLPKKNVAVLFAMVFMVSLNFNILGWHSRPLMGPTVPHANTRHLLWTEENANAITPDLNMDYDQSLNRSTYDCQNMTLKLNDFVHMNQTESIRIVGELNRWIGGGKHLNWTKEVSMKKRKIYLNEENIDGGMLETYKLFNKLNIDSDFVDFPQTNRRNLKEKVRLRRLRKNKDIEFPENTVYDYEQLYHKPIRSPGEDFDFDIGEWNALLQALQRRDDTFYVVGVGKGEHLLLPAVAHNITRPPKMAFILPAKGNDSLLNDHVTLMQIDCSVVNTSLVKLKSDALPGRKKKDQSMELSKPIQATIAPENKINKDPIDTISLKNTSNAKKNPKNEIFDEDKGDLFAQYLLTKYEKSKGDSKSIVSKNKRNK